MPPKKTASAKQRPLPVTVLSGFLGAGKTTLLKHILHTNHGWRVAVIVNDMAEVNVDANSVSAEIKHVKESLVQMQNGCICCTLREDLLIEVKKLAQQGAFDYLLIESSGISEPLQVAETFTFDDETGSILSDFAQLDTMVTVVDGVNIQRDLKSTESLKDRKWEADDGDVRTIPHLLLDQLEFANVIVLNKCDLMTDAEKNKVRAVLERINPSARVLMTQHGVVGVADIINTHSFTMEQAKKNPGWLKEVRGTHKPETEEYGVSSFVFRARRPLHCGRLHKLLRTTGDKAVFRTVLRAKGTCWLTSSQKMSVVWEQAGTLMEMRPGSLWVAAVDEDDRDEMDQDEVKHAKEIWEEPYGDRRQEMVFIGTEMDTHKPLIEKALRACLLTDAEFAKGPEKWTKLTDPIGVMVGVDQALSDQENEEDDDDNEEEAEEEEAQGGGGAHGHHHDGKPCSHDHHHHQHGKVKKTPAAATKKKEASRSSVAAGGKKRNSAGGGAGGGGGKTATTTTTRSSLRSAPAAAMKTEAEPAAARQSKRRRAV